MERIVEKRRALQQDVGDNLQNLLLQKKKKRLLYSVLFSVFGLKIEEQWGGGSLRDKSTEVTEVKHCQTWTWRFVATSWLSTCWDSHAQPSLMTGLWLSRSKLDTTLPIFHACSQYSAIETCRVHVQADLCHPSECQVFSYAPSTQG